MGGAPGDRFITGMKWSRVDVDRDEWNALEKWYSDMHGRGGLDHVPFLPFMFRNHARALKQYRRWAETMSSGAGLEGPPIPRVVRAMTALHFYVTLAYSDGIIDEIIACRSWGASKAQVQELLALAWLHAGPYGLNTTARVADDFMRSWDEGDVATEGVEWPDGWEPAPELFHTDLDYSTNTLSSREEHNLEEWHRQWQGEVPQYVTFLAEHYPAALKAFRCRYEIAIGGALPKQVIPLLELHLAIQQRRADAARRAAVHAMRLGVSGSQVVHVAASCAVYLGDTGSDVIPDSLIGVIGELTSDK